MTSVPATTTVTSVGRWLALVAAFLGWYFAGMLLQVTSLTMRPAAIDLLAHADVIQRAEFDSLSQRVNQKDATLTPIEIDRNKELQSLVQRWFAYFTCAFLFGGACGGLAFGRLGDRFGRSKALAASVLCYATFSGLAYFVTSPWQLVVVWFVTCLGVGGSWPNGVALVAEMWASLSRPMVSGIIGMAANIGIWVMATIATRVLITPDDWRWTMLVGAGTFPLGVLILLFVPESPRWHQTRAQQQVEGKPAVSMLELFRGPHWKVTLMGILLATVPIMGGWGSANWMIPWADQVVGPVMKARVGQYRAFTGVVGSFIGGWVAARLGRRLTYFLACVLALGCSQFAFWFRVPGDADFLGWVGAIGFFSGLFFGWLPLCLPELFPTSIRSTGAGVCFNFGRIGSALSLVLTGTLTTYFGGDYGRIGRVTSLIYAIGLVAILFAPQIGQRSLDESGART